MLRKILLGSLIGIFVLAVAGSAAFWKWQGDRLSAPGEQALAATQSSEKVVVERGDWLVFEPRDRAPRAGIIFYPGAHCPVEGYAPLLSQLAEEGYRVVAVSMPLYMAFLAPDRASEVILAYPETGQWAIAGHSLGGAMVAGYAYRNPSMTEAVIILDSHPPEYESLAEFAAPVLMVHRAAADGTAPELYQNNWHLFPTHTRIVPLPGGAHMDFGDFVVGSSRQDLPGSLGAERQQQLTARAILDFLSTALDTG
jgi:pimeloyl-ACP methyl ester carboxylesterase